MNKYKNLNKKKLYLERFALRKCDGIEIINKVSS